ncbi:MAG TPA: TIGR02466 family protein [Kiloniellaceae bacterium]|nr:TIGR02466 family protein [Kiloniellaceae bacterium]
MAEIVNFFPLSIFRESLPIDPDLRTKLVAEILAMERASSNGKPGWSWTGDVQGYEFLHRNQHFQPLFGRFAAPLKAYLETLGVNSDKMETLVTRAWGTISRRGEQIHAHSHRQSHISLVYYLQKPEGSCGIQFLNYDAPNEFAPKLFDDSMVRAEVLRQKQPLNAVTVNLNPSEGDLLIFPSKTVHGIVPSKADDERVSLAVDIVVTAKDSNGLEFLLPNQSNWMPL